ncbi:hypothetical protein TSL6_01320 [Sulfurovum sp. TSL6]|uniref:hypothetical protein n=1 Tax=Sulfurovum sp. TSL6 TaxID=2826995 RepID=UPI001CC665F5|nr:hypothetical protein [Sulfurovum sp. TSL6]GIT99625.1 hypothetical protein TSL6_01320 [Sulfurovum sp. TSL6]
MNIKNMIVENFPAMIKSLLLSVITVFFLIFILPLLAIYISYQLSPDPPLPKVTYGEFPFKLEYSIDGKKFTVSDTLICEYDGIGINEAVGKHRKWKSHLASKNDRITLLKINDSLEIYYSPGYARYYMGDLYSQETYNHMFPDAGILTQEDSRVIYEVISAKDLFSKYKIKLLHWEHTTPIVNHFVLSE